MYSKATQTRVIIGQNGIVVVTGRDIEGLSLAVKAIKMVEEESHTTNLTQRVKSLLNSTIHQNLEASYKMLYLLLLKFLLMLYLLLLSLPETSAQSS